MGNPVNATNCNSRIWREWSRYTLHDEAELEQSDRRAGHDYLPMDIDVGSQERREHFSALAVLKRLRKRL
ncbi:MAG: hypothetical protein WBG92_01000 [Thiohalocapsa sp.]